MPKIMFIVLILLVSGCAPGGLKVQTVSGTITYQGKPLDNAVITFVAVSPEIQGASGISNADGSYVLATPGAQSSGAMAGEYHVFVSKKIPVDASGKPIPDEPEIIPAGRPNTEQSGEDYVTPRLKSVIPEKYCDTSRPLLKTTIVKGKNVCNFNLEE
jgi:uncharacterized GH25 family protein